MYADITPAITSTVEVLEGLAGVREQSRLLDRGLVVLAVEWAKHHPSPSGSLPMLTPVRAKHDHQGVFDELAASGCVSFDDDAVTEFAVAAGLTEYSARKLIRESIMLVHFLPRVWSRVLSGGLDVWRARNLAGDCIGLSPAAMRFVDSQMAETSARITPSTRESIVQEARNRFMPEVTESGEDEAKGARAVDLHLHAVNHGVVPLQATLDLPDALALEAAITAGAQALEDAGSDAPLDTRRSWALGDLARTSTGHGTLLPNPQAECACACHEQGAWVPARAANDGESGTRPYWNGKGASPPGVKLFIHLSDQTIDPSRASSETPVGKVEGKGIPGMHICTPERIREWFTRPTLAGAFMPKVHARPTLDRGEEVSSDAYRPPERSQEHVQLSHRECIFPFCTRPAHVCDTDHTIPWKPEGQGGATCTCNLSPLCRTHHRLKTHGDNAPTANGEHNTWAYTNLGGNEYYWKGPRGWRFIRNNRGTFDASTDLEGGAPAHASLFAALGNDQQRDASEDLIRRLLTKASLTRGIHTTDLSPRWAIPTHEPTSDPPDEWDENGEYVGPNTFFLIEASFPLAS